MPDYTTEAGTLYSPLVGLIYIFNLIVGTGALTMPDAFSHAGWLIGLVLIILLSFMSYLTATFVIESMASANAMIQWREVQRLKKGSLNSDDVECLEDYNSMGDAERRPLLPTNDDYIDSKIPRTSSTDYYEITEKIEMGQMASLFFNKYGKNFFYLCIAIYLYGDLAIYATAVPKSLRDIVCTANFTAFSTSSLCWTSVPSISRANAYRIFVTVFAILVGPFTFFNVQKTKYLQVLTSFLRWFSFSTMIILAIIRIGKGQGTGHPPVGNFMSIPNLFGVCVYAFMCHHSLPSLISPIKNKDRLYSLLLGDYLLILSFYLVLSFTGIFAFEHLEDLYTLNFKPSSCDAGGECGTDIPFIQYFLVLFPVFTLSTNFPIISITLRNNLKALLFKEGRTYPWLINQIIFPLITLLPPLAIALSTEDVKILVGITGAYAGAGIQYVTPAALVFFARKDVLLSIGNGVTNKHSSPFRHRYWIYFVFIWAITCLLFVTIDYIIPKEAQGVLPPPLNYTIAPP